MFVDQHLILILVPCPYFTGFNLGSVKVFSFFCNMQSSGFAELIGKVLLSLKIRFRLMQLTSVHKGYRIGYDVDMQVILVLVNGDQALEVREEPLAEELTNFQTLCWGYEVICMETDHMMGAHSPGVLPPKLLLI